jgi:cell division protein FtsN
MKRPDYETMAKEPMAQAQLPSMRDLARSEVKKIPQKSMVAKPEEGAGESKKKDVGPIASQPAKAQVRASTDAAGDPERDIKKSASIRKTDLAPAKPDLKASLGFTPERSSESVSDKEAAERIALTSRAVEIKPTNTKTSGPPKALEGFIIQLAFTDRVDARRWAETMERRGYAVSVTEAGGNESFRVRVGNFTFRDEADRELLSLKQSGLVGIVINLPHAYRPEARVSSSDTPQAQ